MVLFDVMDDRGGTIRVVGDSYLSRSLAALGSRSALRVTVRGTIEKRAGQVPERAVRIADVSIVSASAFGPISGAKPYVVLLCRFADSVNVTPAAPAFYQTLVSGPGYPSVDDFWREVSNGAINLGGSAVAGWFNLPSPRSTYIPDNTNLNVELLLSDCTARADASVDFTRYAGIVVQANAGIGPYFFGNVRTLVLDGQQQTFGVMWMGSYTAASDAAAQYTLFYAHEMGHTFGLTHSFGGLDGQTSSRWDVMSSSGSLTYYDPFFRNLIPPHAIAYHKDFLGWIPAQRQYLAARGSSQVITLERSAQPQANANYLLAKIPIPSRPAQMYTLEARRYVGYDAYIPVEGVVVHRVDTTLAGFTARSLFLSADPSGNPNSNIAAWRAGATFVDSLNDIRVAVLAATALGYTVRVSFQAPPVVSLSASGADFSATGGDDPATQAITLTSTGSAIAGLAIGTVSYTGSASGWLSATLSGTSTPATLSLRATTATLRAGQYTATVPLTWPGTGSPAVATISATVTEPALDAVASQLLGSATLSAATQGWLDRFGNANGSFDLGDLLAYLDRTGQKLSVSSTLSRTTSDARAPRLDRPRRPR